MDKEKIEVIDEDLNITKYNSDKQYGIDRVKERLESRKWILEKELEGCIRDIMSYIRIRETEKEDEGYSMIVDIPSAGEFDQFKDEFNSAIEDFQYAIKAINYSLKEG